MNKKHNKFWVVNELNKTTAEIYLYGYIGNDEDMNTALFVSTLRELYRSHKEIKLYINSAGGSVYDGMALISVLRECGDKITGYVEGIAASMAFILSQVLKACYISKYGRVMSHRARGGCWGNADEMRACADEIENCEKELVKVVSAKTGLNEADTRMMYFGNTDRWINAEQAVSEGLYKGIYDGKQVEISTAITDAKVMVSLYNQALNRNMHSDDVEQNVYVIVSDINTGDTKGTLQQKYASFDELCLSYDELIANGRFDALRKADSQVWAYKYQQKHGKYPASVNIDKTKQEAINCAYINKRVKELRAKSYNDLFMSGELAELKGLSDVAYREKYKDRFGRYPSN